ncbi:hypothetical protein [Flavobacterium sp.]|uniref:hypothetical protein n=1 Tax=Flavobacterium sp. TaxID=239 RepID=UPI00286E7B53|nr:hypothetical protein [Flavobacterium sp.]
MSKIIKFSVLLLISFTANTFCQEFNYDLDKNGEIDSVNLDKENYVVNIKLNKSNTSFEIPEITAYEKISLVKFKSEFINIHYSSSSVSSIDLFVQYKNKKWILTSTLFYSPCQTCENGEVKTCENIVNLDINKINEENVESIVFNEINCRKLYKNIKGISVKDLNSYTSKILIKECVLNEIIVNKTLQTYPVDKKNILMYKSVKKTLDKIKLNVEKLNNDVLNFDNKNSKVSKK